MLAAAPDADRNGSRGISKGIEAGLGAAVHVVSTGALENADHFVKSDGLTFAGTHLIVDLWDASHLDDIATVSEALREAATAARATVLKLELHSFSPSGGVTGVAVLAESHISIHTWPERAFAAVDVFMCGNADPHRAIEVLRRTFAPRMLTVSEHKRGIAP
jgi:S-adenosylmethionine decarboxylase